MAADQQNNHFIQPIKENANGFNEYEFDDMSFALPIRYRDVFYVSQGSFGAVFSAVDRVTGQRKAIKKIFRPFNTPYNAKLTYREIKIGQLVRHPNLIALENLFSPDISLVSFSEIYIVMPYMQMSLRDFIHEEQGCLTHDSLSKLMFQTFSGISHLNQAEIKHRDLSPRNIALNLRGNGDHELKILDYGYARMRTNDKNTPYVATPYYRAPEVLLGSETYGFSIDMWALGCVMSETINGKILLEGNSKLDQMIQILKLLGRPNNEFSRLLPKRGVEFLNEIKGDFQQHSWDQILTFNRISDSRDNSRGNQLAVDLISKLVTYTHRLNVTDALNHPYFDHINRQTDIVRTTLGRYDFTLEQMAADDCDKWKQIIYSEVQMYRESHEVFATNQIEPALNV